MNQPRSVVLTRASLIVFLVVEIASVACLQHFTMEISWHEQGRNWTLAEVKRHFHAELSPMSDRGQVADWFVRHDIHHGFDHDSESWRVGHQSVREIVGLKAEDLSGMESGTIEPPDTDVDWFFNGRINVVLFFDKKDRLAADWITSFTYEP